MAWSERTKAGWAGFVTTIGIFLLVVAGAAFAVDGLTVGAGQVLVDTQLVWVLFVVVMLGMAGGLAYDITEPLRPGKSWKASDFENRTSIPSLRAGVQEWGFVGPMLVGAVGALVVLFLVGLDRLPADDAINPSAQFISLDRLIFLPLLAGFAGSLALRVLRSRLAAALRITELTEVAAKAKSALEKKQDSSVPVKATVEAALVSVQAAQQVPAVGPATVAKIETELNSIASMNPSDPSMATKVDAAKNTITAMFESASGPVAIAEVEASLIKLDDVLEADAEADPEVEAALHSIDAALEPAAG